MTVPFIDDAGSPLVCARLRTKGGGVRYGERVRWESGFITNAIFWCVETADPVGPDDGPVHPHRCVAGRACYRVAPKDLPVDK